MVLAQKDLNVMLETAVAAARLAGRQAMKELNIVKASIKNKTELVTQTDIRCQQIIIDRIKETYPDHGFIAEEGNGGNLFKQPPRGEPFWWVIDPIDGTNNFAYGILLFVVSIALMHEGEPVAGVIFDPATESMFTAVKGGEAQLNGRRIFANESGIDQFSNLGLDSHFDNGLPGWACKLMERTRFRNLGTAALQLAYVAKGGLIATIFACPKIWDIAAGALIAETAGAVVTNWQGGKIFPLDLDNYKAEKLPIIASNKKVHNELLQLLK